MAGVSEFDSELDLTDKTGVFEKLMSINEMDDQKEMAIEQGNLLLKIVDTWHEFTKVDFEALVDKCSQQSFTYSYENGYTLLHIAALKGKYGFLRVLLDHANPNYRYVTDNNGCVPLHRAADSGSVQCVRELLDGADPEYRYMTAKNGFTPLHYAAYGRHEDCIHELLDGADPKYRYMADKNGNTCLHFAACSGSTHCIRALLDGADSEYRSITNKNERTAFDEAKKHNRYEALELLKIGKVTWVWRTKNKVMKLFKY
eukprot:TRINITY_DN6986_c0_g1_i1.p1 TRINITY_DN6986_c0_g1~~TRINITY_DN6986_c0_g1_i1.p1  ORF type:complete len:258 (+),score=62.17 TRINITY_DN6986_c0_g1_i1:121-894(+)